MSDKWSGKNIKNVTDTSGEKLTKRSADAGLNFPDTTGDNDRKPFNGVEAYMNIPDEAKEVENLAPKSDNAYMNLPVKGSFGTGNS
jgi:hypothetical protein